MNRQVLLEIDARWSARLCIADRPGRLRTLTAILAHTGDSWFWILGLVLTWWWGETQWKIWALRILGMILALAFIVMVLKFSIRRRRPVGEWGAIYRSTDPHSFPSGHAARAALLATLATAWGPPWLGALLVLWVPFVSLARVAMGVHYLSDVLVGIFLGLSVGLIGLLILG
ncbi:MAG: phosphatase PAP2 family protein [Anaerolineales bacterium]|nr:MAG: phosphatase PAP2 family protein [Anaerolineales bacterium]